MGDAEKDTGRGCQRSFMVPTAEDSFLVVQSLICVQLFVTPWTAAHQSSLSFTISQSLLKLISIESMMPSNHVLLYCPLLLPSIFPSIRVFFSELALHITEKALAPHSSTLAWRIQWTEEPGRLQSMGSRRVGHN